MKLYDVYVHEHGEHSRRIVAQRGRPMISGASIREMDLDEVTLEDVQHLTLQQIKELLCG